MSELIQRREYKYFTDEGTAIALSESLRPFCTLDAHAARRPDRRYTIDSLYFDTPGLALYEANYRELVDRFKLRVRRYPQAPAGPVFLEVKRRADDAILKTRGRVALERWAEVVQRCALEGVDPAERGAVERFCALVHTYGAGPVTLVRYEREAWISQIDGYARVTIDRLVRSQRWEELSFAVHPTNWRANDSGLLQNTLQSMAIVELKFTSAVPRWMMHLVQRFDLVRHSFSKYGTSIEAWFRTPPRRVPRRHGVRA